jgi:hypothetical protein|tara:strand:- start:4477 stop:4782 length:306 start_codon:yes stop_codon:yes gene_type:complete
VFGILLKIVGVIERLTMTKLCARGKNAAKRKFKVYPSAYANAYASKICAGKIKDPSGLKRKDFKGPKKKMAGGKRVGKPQGKIAKGCGAVMSNRRKRTKYT